MSLPFDLSGVRTATATFENWQKALDVLSDTAIHIEGRVNAKDAMICMQQIIINCRESRKYQRDAIPPDQVITVRFGDEWSTAFSVLSEMNWQMTGGNPA